MSNGSDIAAEIAGALADVGNDTGTGPLIATVTRPPVDSPVNPWDEPGEDEPTTYDLTVIRDSWRFGEVDGTKILMSDLKLMAQAGVTVPTTDDTLTLQGVTYRIMDVQPEAVGGVDLFYIIQARK